MPLLGVDEVRAAMAPRGGRPLLIVDIAMPRDVEPAVAELDGVDLLDMDGIRAFADRGLAERRREVPAVRAIVDEELDRYESARTSRAVAPIVAEMHRWAEGVRQGELERFSSSWPSSTPPSVRSSRPSPGASWPSSCTCRRCVSRMRRAVAG